MKIRSIKFSLVMVFLTIWLVGLLAFGNNYKLLEVELLLCYITTLAVIVKSDGIFGEIPIFLITYGVFLCSYPFMNLLVNFDITVDHFWGGTIYSSNDISVSLNALIITLIAVLFGSCLIKMDEQKDLSHSQNNIGKDMPAYLTIIYIVLFVAVIIYRVFQVRTYQASGYLSLFSEIQTSSSLSRFDFILQVYDAVFYIILSFRPKKKQLIICIIMYVISVVPQFLIGRRAPVLIVIVFVLWYWNRYIHRIKIRYASIGTLGAMFISNAVANIRNNKPVVFDFSFIESFFESQGVSFDTLASTVKYYDRLREINNVHVPYFLGMVHKYVVYIFDKLMFKSSVFGRGQTVEAMDHSCYLGWKLTYLMSPSQYIKGRGTGSSFVAENFLSYQYFGCFFITIMMLMLFYHFKKRVDTNGSIYDWTIYYIIFKFLIYTPRNNFWIFISDVIVAMFLLVIMNVVFPRIFNNVKVLTSTNSTNHIKQKIKNT